MGAMSKFGPARPCHAGRPSPGRRSTCRRSRRAAPRALIDQRTDLLLGVIPYEALAGEPPLTGENVGTISSASRSTSPRRSRLDCVPGVDRGFAAIVAKAMAKDVNARYQTAEEMLDAVKQWRTQFDSGAQLGSPRAAAARDEHAERDG